MPPARHALSVLACAVASVAAVSCGGDEAAEVIRVPADAPTIAEAVSRAREGDLVLIAPGTYREAVRVEHEGITIRGEDRNSVILDGEDARANGIHVVADGVSVENLTLTRYQQNGLIFDGGYGRTAAGVGTGQEVLSGYRASWVTSYNNGLYGIYAFAARDGLIEHSLASGHPDSGIYVGQCRPCNVVIRYSLAERNSIGYYGTNASGGVWVIESTFRHNRLGLTPNSQKSEALAPQQGTVIAGNHVHDNDDPATPRIMNGYFGGGIAVGGGIENVIVNNLVEGHDGAGIHVTSLDGFLPERNRITGNLVRNNGTDLVYDADPADGRGNCFADNVFVTSAPVGIEGLLGCSSESRAPGAPTFRVPPAPPGIDHRRVQAPDPQPGMPDALSAPVRRAGPPPAVDVASIRVPTRPG